MKWSEMDDDEFLEKVVSFFNAAKDASSDWRTEAKKAFDYRAGNQLSDDERQGMADTEVDVAFNRIDVFVSAITGLETLNRTETRYISRRPGNTPAGMAAAMWDAAARYADDDCDAQTHQSDAFADMVTCGIGVTEDRVDWYSNPDGDLKCEKVDPLCMYWDPASEQKNMSDARIFGRVKMMRAEDIEAQFDKGEDDWEPSTNFFDADDDVATAKEWSNSDPYAVSPGRGAKRPREGTHPVLQIQWCELEDAWQVTMGGAKMPVMSDEDYRVLKANFESILAEHPGVDVPPVQERKIKRQHWHQAFVAGNTVLERGDAPSQAGSTFQFMTGKRDRNAHQWYGQVRAMIDPQDWSNRLYGKILSIMQYNSHGGGYLAEENAFVDPSTAEDTLADYSKITWASEGAITSGKIMQKPAIGYPEGLDRLMLVAADSFINVTAISLELLGLANRNQPGVLENQRKQAGMTVLAWAFDAMRAYRKSRGRVHADMIRNFIADGRLFRIYNPQAGEEQYIPLLRDELALEYDILVEESPKSTNEQERTLAIILQLAPVLERAGIMPPSEILDHLPLPTPLVEKWKQQIEGSAKQQEAEAAKQVAMQKEASEIAKNQAKAALDQAQAQKVAIETMSGVM